MYLEIQGQIASLPEKKNGYEFYFLGKHLFYLEDYRNTMVIFTRPW